MQQKPIIQYFLNGFSLTNRSLDILLINLFLFLPLLKPTLLINYTQNSIFGAVLLLLAAFLLAFISIGFLLSIPVFLVQKQQKKALDYRHLGGVVIKNTRRIILPGVLLLVLLAVTLILLAILIEIFLHPNPSSKEITSFFQSIGKGWYLIFFILLVVITFFEFTSFFFSLEHDGLFSSMKKSISVAFNNLHYISIVILISIIYSLIISFVPIGTFWGQWRLVRMFLDGYISLAVISSSLFYYQNVIKRAL